MRFRVYGNVKDPETNKPLTEVIVKLYLDQEELQQSKSVENGFYESIVDIDDSRIESGQQLKVTFENEGYQIQEQRVLATEGAFNLDVKLKKVPLEEKKPFNWKPVIIGGAALVVILIIGVIALKFLSGPKPVDDTTPPTVTITPSPSNPTSSQQIAFTSNASDDGGLSKIEIRVNNVLVQVCTGSSCTFKGGPFRVGTVTYKADAYDKAGNMKSTGFKRLTVKQGIKPAIMKPFKLIPWEAKKIPTRIIK